MAWLNQPATVGFLFRDIDGNGIPHNGRELFGNTTMLHNGHIAVNGFQALAEYDDNRDGVIAPDDAEWPSFRLWFDLNRDGKATLNEVFPLSDFGIVALQATPQWSGRTERMGNQYRWRAKFATSPHNGALTWQAFYDIYLATSH